MNTKYNDKEVADITQREKECLEFLQKKFMTPSAVVQKYRLAIEGVDVYADQVIPFLQDFKYKK